MKVRGQNNVLGSKGFGRLPTILGIAVVSAVYFTDIVLKASRKCFWFDELFVVYLCRLPTFSATWTAVTHGTDFNPPLLYLMTRLSQRLFGDGLIATRIPEVIGVWLFCLCLFLFVARRCDAICGFIAGVFPFFTLAQYYAYEARAHGMVLGWCGLALVCWQRIAEERESHLWLVAFGLSITGAMMTHVYAVFLLLPFAIVEAYNFSAKRRVAWRIIAATALTTTLVAFGVYLPLFRAFRSTVPATFSVATHDMFNRFLVNVIGPATMVLLLWLLLIAWDGTRRGSRPSAVAAIPDREMVLALAFTCIPLVGLIGAKISHAPFFDRYFLSSIAGYAIALGFASSRCYGWTSRAFAGCMFLLMIGDLGTILYRSVEQRILLTEPAGGLRLSTNPSAPMDLYGCVLSNNGGLDTLVLPGFEYFYFFRYAPPSVVSHLYFGAQPDDLFFISYEKLAKEAHVNLQETTFGPFLATHNHFFLYELKDRVHVDAMEAIASRGYRLKSVRTDTAGIMQEYIK